MTLFSQLMNRLALRLNYTKSVRRLLKRISSKILALTAMQFFNHMEGLPIGHLKNSTALQ